MEAEIVMPDGNRRFFPLDESAGLVSHYRDSTMYDSLLERTFAERFEEIDSEWQIEREVAIINLKETVFIPDFAFRHTDGRTALLEASYWGQPEVVKLLLEKGADVNAKDEAGHTAVIDAAQAGHPDIVALLLGKGADANAKAKEGRTALMEAASGGQVDAMQALLTGGADVRAKNDEGRTALMLAAYFGQTKACQVLLDKGANVDEKDKKGYVALDFAKSGNHKDTVEVLSKAHK